MSQLNIVEKIYRDVLRGEIIVQSAQADLEQLAISLQETKIIVTPDDVIYVLQKFLSGILPSEYLIDWSSFLILGDMFVDPQWKYNQNSNEDLYEPMWWVLQQLTCPAIDGEVTFNRVTKLVKDLKDFKKQLANIT